MKHDLVDQTGVHYLSGDADAAGHEHDLTVGHRHRAGLAITASMLPVTNA